MKTRVSKTVAAIDKHISVVRGARVILDADLAHLYGVPTKQLNQAVRRNATRFPPDFAFQLSVEQYRLLRSQFVTSKAGRGGRRTRPWAFTEHGAIMAATVLNSSRAAEMSVFVVRAFVRLREMAATHADLAAKLRELEQRVSTHDDELKQVITALRRLLSPPPKAGRAIGFS